MIAGRTVGLCMIVRDEAAVIERCLQSVRPLIDSWTICDTGSADRTPELVEAALAGVPGTLHRRPWVDFGHNRSELMAEARGSADYLLLLDADMTIEVAAPVPPLEAESYMLRERGDLDYAIPRLVRGDLEWRYRGSTHEYLDHDGERRREELPQLSLTHHADGGTRAEKFERDAALLERDLAHDPENQRATFYLAQTMRDLGRTQRAIELYGRRVELGGWDEERFYAAYQRGLLVAATDPEAGLELLNDAHRLRPERAEPLCDAAAVARGLERWELADELATAALAVPYPSDVLFVHRDVYVWRARLEAAVAAWHRGRYEESLTHADAVLEVEGAPPHAQRAAEETRQWALRSLGRPAALRRFGRRESLADLVGGAQLGEIRVDVDPDWPAMNPSIASDPDGGFRMTVRTVNFEVEGGRYLIFDDDGVVRTINYVATLDSSLALQALEPLEGPKEDSPPSYPTAIRGFEDLRLVEVEGRWLAVAAVRDRNPDAHCEIALLALDGATVQRAALLPGPDPERDEKNWAPFVRDGNLDFVYGWGPTVVRRYDDAAAGTTEVSSIPAPWPAALLRGGSQGVEVADGHLFVTHEVLQMGLPRRYSHRFVLIDRDLAIAGISPPFHFCGAEVEYCAGLARNGGELVLSFGCEDRHAMLAVVEADRALASLENPEPTVRTGLRRSG